MNTILEKEIVDKFFQLDEEGQRRVRALILAGPPKEFDMEEWLEEGNALRKQIRERLGEGNYVGVDDILRELREERSWPPSF